MTAKRIPLPPSVGGGDVVMRVLTVGEYEDVLKAFSGGSAVDAEAALIQRSITAFRGKPVPGSLTEREAWWRGQDLPVREVLATYYDKMNAANSDEVADFFKAAEPERT